MSSAYSYYGNLKDEVQELLDKIQKIAANNPEVFIKVGNSHTSQTQSIDISPLHSPKVFMRVEIR